MCAVLYRICYASWLILPLNNFGVYFVNQSVQLNVSAKPHKQLCHKITKIDVKVILTAQVHIAHTDW